MSRFLFVCIVNTQKMLQDAKKKKNLIKAGNIGQHMSGKVTIIYHNYTAISFFFFVYDSRVQRSIYPAHKCCPDTYANREIFFYIYFFILGFCGRSKKKKNKFLLYERRRSEEMRNISIRILLATPFVCSVFFFDRGSLKRLFF